MDKNKARSLSNAALELLIAYFKTQGIKVTLGNGKFDDHSLTTHFVFSEPNEAGTFVAPEEKCYREEASSYGLGAVPFGATFQAVNGGTYTICGLKPRSGKYPILAKCNRTGRTFKFAPNSILVSMSLNKASN